MLQIRSYLPKTLFLPLQTLFTQHLCLVKSLILLIKPRISKILYLLRLVCINNSTFIFHTILNSPNGTKLSQLTLKTLTIKLGIKILKTYLMKIILFTGR